ncbi:integrase [Salmonella enterica subsp. enterica]|nr:DUF4102 domain-containing protein [Salmonella enterica]EAT2223410.1 DUF4102 domain-containing protein [Salmonella enterica]ECG1137200.1 integrase [Salmonella enterica subsp. enterica]EEO5743299.1 tyrosine-type recombinase/integrase [Salmonella enterica]
MLIKPLTHTEVKNARKADKDYSLHDGFGLLLYVSKAGGKTWRFRYQHPDTKKRQTLTIGRYPEFTLAEAREARDEARRLVARGIDPNDSRRKFKQERIRLREQTFKNIASDWLGLYMKGNKRSNTIKTVTRAINVYLIPEFGSLSVHDIKAENAISVLRKYDDRAAQQKKIVQTLCLVMDYAVNTGIIAANPLARIHKALPPTQSKRLNALKIERLPYFLQCWEAQSNHPSTIFGLLFQILTMTRPGEAFGAEWKEIDIDNGLWVIPAGRMKGKREHVVPLSSQALDIIQRMRKIKKGAYVFYGAYRENNPITNSAITVAINRSGFAKEMTAHGFRSMWSTLLNEEGFNPDVIEAALAHKSGNSVRDIYNRTTYLEQRAIMMQWIGDFVDAARKGIINRTSGKRGLRLVNE